MKSKFAMRAAAGVLALALAAGAFPFFPSAGSSPVFSAITAEAASFSVQVDTEAHTLTLGGDLSDRTALQESLKMVDWDEIDTLKVEPDTVFPESSAALFSGYDTLVSVDLTGADFSNVKQIDAMFTGCTALRSVNLSNLNFSSVESASSCFNNCRELESVDLTGSSFTAAKNLGAMFGNCYGLKSVKGLSVNSPFLENISMLFFNCVSLPEIDLSAVYTDTATSFREMFGECSSLTELDLSTFRTGNAEDFRYMFMACSSLRSLDLSGFDTSNVTVMADMFNGCQSLRSLDISSFVTVKVKEMENMFINCSKLKKLDLSKFTLADGVNARQMFGGCSDLTELDISGMDSSKFSSEKSVLSGLTHLEKLTLGELFPEVTEDMALHCPQFGWVNENDPDTVISEKMGVYNAAVFSNSGKNTYLSRGDYGRITGTKLLLLEDGSIGLRFYAELSEYMDETDRELGDPWFFIYDTDSSATDHYRAQKDADGRYYVSVKIPAKNMADRIHAELYFYSRRVVGLDEGEEPAQGAWSAELDEVYYSVRDYADIILSDPEKYPAEQDVIKAMLCYGGAAQRHFGNYDPTRPYISGLSDMGIEYEGPALKTVNKFKKPDELSGLAYTATSVVLGTCTVQRHYFTLKAGDIGDYTFTVDGDEVTPQDYGENNLYYIDTEGVPAMRLYDVLTISAVSKADPSESMTYQYSALDYVRLAVEKGRLTGTAAAAAKALGQFALEVRNYLNLD